MKRICRSIHIAVLLAVAGIPALAQESFRVDSLAIEGLQSVSEERVRLEFGVLAGDQLDREKLAEAMMRLHRSQRFSDIRVDATLSASGSGLLRLKLKEYPRISELRWEGLKKIKQDDLAEKIRLAVGSYGRPLQMEKDRAAILAFCREKGYHSARVETESELVDGRLKLTVRLHEGEKTKIKRLEFLGNESFSDDELSDALSSKPRRRLNPFTWRNSNAYQPDSLAADVNRLMEFYHQNGFLDARVLDTQAQLNEAQDRVDLSYKIEEGSRYDFGAVQWEGNTVFSDSLIAYYLPFQAGEPFDGFELDRSLALISENYYDRGYLYNHLEPERNLRDHRVDIKVRINEGPLARVRQVIVEGNDKTLDKVIRREIRIFPGELFNRERVVRSHRDIFMLRFFDDVQFEPRSDPGTGEVDLVFRVVERNTGNFGAGVTYSESTSITGFIQVGATNFRGRGQTLDFQWEFGKRVHLFNIQYVEPWFRDRPVTLSGNVYRSRSNLYSDFYTDEKLGFSVGLGRPLPWLDDTRISAAYTLESLDLFDFSQEYIDQGGSLAQKSWPEVESSITLTLLRDSTDSPFLPNSGTRFRLSGQFAGGILAGNLNYQKYMSQYTWYQKLAGPFVLRFHQDLGLVDGLDRPDQVPDQERFRLGGNRLYPLRGYDDFSILPKGNSAFLGGRAMTSGTVEIVLGVSNSVQIVFPFFDFGGTWNSMSEADLSTLRRSLGFGARIEIPLMGVLGFDWGYPLDPIGADRGRFHFKMGTDF